MKGVSLAALNEALESVILEKTAKHAIANGATKVYALNASFVPTTAVANDENENDGDGKYCCWQQKREEYKQTNKKPKKQKMSKKPFGPFLDDQTSRKTLERHGETL